MQNITIDMQTGVYVVCALAALACAVMLWRSYRQTGFRLLLWAGLCFALLTLNNVVLFIDVALVPNIDLSWLRQSSALFGGITMLYGFIWEAQ